MLLHNKVMSVVGILGNDVDPMVSVMKVDQAPTESYADVGGLEQQIQVWTQYRVIHWYQSIHWVSSCGVKVRLKL